MVNYALPLYQNPQYEWTVAKCEKIAKRIAKDGMGTQYPFAGYIYRHEINVPYNVEGLRVRYNGGCIRNGEWYQGEEWFLPILPEGFEIIRVPTWGFRLIDRRAKS